MSQVRRLMRRLQNAGNAQESRGYVGTSALNRAALDPREYLVEQQDRFRTNLAERLLEIAIEECRIGDFTDCHEVGIKPGTVNCDQIVPALTVEQWLVKLAEGALAAAEVVYPELPELPQPDEVIEVDEQGKVHGVVTGPLRKG